MSIADKSIFKSIMQYFLARSIALMECYLLMTNSEKNSFYRFQNIRKNANLMVKPLQNVIFWKVGCPNIFFRKYFPLVVSKLYTKFLQLSLPKTAILKNS